MRLQKQLLSEQVAFDGHQLEAGWTGEDLGLQGEGIVAFIGSFQPDPQIIEPPSSWEAFRDREMLHLVVAHGHDDLEKLRLQQHLLLNVLKEKLNHRLRGDLVQRWGCDLFYESAQVSVSTTLLTVSSAIIYVGITLTGDQQNEKSWGIRQGAIDPLELAEVVMDQYIFEVENTRK